MTTRVELDGRKRVSLGRYATAQEYLLNLDADGTITLTPAVTIAAVEANLLQRPDLLDRIDRFRETGEGTRSDRPSRG